MRYRVLGRTGLRVSELALGAMTFGEAWGWGAGREDCRRILDTYLDAGGNFIDTANIYTSGQSEEYLGELLNGRRHQVVLATKYANHPPGRDPNAAGNHRKSLIRSLEASLSRLGTDYVDLLWVHVPDRFTPVDELMRALDDVVRAGKVLYVGASNFPAWRIAQANTLAELRGWREFAGIQIHYNLLDRTAERDLIPMAREFGLTVTAWSPLANGLLTGKYEHADGRPGTGRRRLDIHPFVTRSERNRRVVTEVVRVAAELRCTPAQAALGWVMSRAAVPIVGARSVAQLQENLSARELALPAEMISRLDEVSRVEPGYPHDFLADAGHRSYGYAGMYDRIIQDATVQ